MSNAQIKTLKIGLASCGIAAGGEPVYEKLCAQANGIPVVKVGCLGHCYAEPLVEAVLTDGSSVFYGNVPATDEAVANIIALGEKGRFEVPAERKAKELVKVLALAGRIDPTDFSDYTANVDYETAGSGGRGQIVRSARSRRRRFPDRNEVELPRSQRVRQ